MKVQRRYVLWSVIVFLNAALGLFFSLQDQKPPIDVLAILAGVITFVIIYIEIDYRLGCRGFERLRRRLVISAWVRAALQLVIWLDVWVGIVAITAVEALIGDVRFLSLYLAVLVDGVLLSLVVLIILSIIHLGRKVFDRWKSTRSVPAPT